MQPESFFPISLDVKDRWCLVLGAGDSALAKMKPLIKAGANIRLVCTKPTPTVQALLKSGAISEHHQTIAEQRLEGVSFAIDSGEEPEQSDLLRRLCKDKNMLLNSVDQPNHCNFHVPAVVRRGPVQVAISTGGAAPTLARNIRQLIERILPHGLEHLVRQAAAGRSHFQKLLSPAKQKAFWNKVFDLDNVADFIGTDERETLGLLVQAANDINTKGQKPGEVWLVGAGAGSADLITLRGLRAIEQADVILHDALIDDALLEYARRDAKLVPVGKRCGKQSSPQDFINRTLENMALQGNKVVRLKCGDPFIFGRGGEELEHLQAKDIKTHIIPGVTAASVAASVTGIPLTHRGVARRITLMTASTNPSLETDKADWAALLKGGTIALYMVRNKLAGLSEDIIGAGFPATLPCCLVANAGLPDQEVHTTTLADLATQIPWQQSSAPVLAIVGETAVYAAQHSIDETEQKLTLTKATA